jgi:hypothetical protein
MNQLATKMNEGGPVFTYVLLALLIVVTVMLVVALLKKDFRQKTKDLLSSVGWFAFAWGFLGRTMGLIKAFDMVSAAGDVSPRLLSEGLKMALLDPLMGIVVFLVARLAIIILIVRQK